MHLLKMAECGFIFIVGFLGLCFSEDKQFVSICGTLVVLSAAAVLVKEIVKA